MSALPPEVAAKLPGKVMNRDGKEFIFVAVLGVGSSDPALLGDFKNRLLSRLRQETAVPWVRKYIRGCVVVTPQTWNNSFPSFPLAVVP